MLAAVGVTDVLISYHMVGANIGCVVDLKRLHPHVDLKVIADDADCDGTVSDGLGAYANSLECGLRVNGFIGSTYTLTFEEFETEQGVDYLRIYDGASVDAPVLAQLSGKVQRGRIPWILRIHLCSTGDQQCDDFLVTTKCRPMQGSPLETFPGWFPDVNVGAGIE